MIEQGASERRLRVADVVGLRCLAYPATHIEVTGARLVRNVGAIGLATPLASGMCCWCVLPRRPQHNDRIVARGWLCDQMRTPRLWPSTEPGKMRVREVPQEIAMAALRGAVADKVLTGEGWYHCQKSRLSGQPDFVLVAYLVPCSVAADDERVSPGRGPPAISCMRWQ